MSVTLRRGIVSELIGPIPIPRDAFHTKAFSDLRIVTSDGGCVDAHRIVVAAASPIMRRSLAATAAGSEGDDLTYMIIPDFTTAQVESAMRLFYGIVAEDECDLMAVRELILPAAGAIDVGEPPANRARKRRTQVPRRQRALPGHSGSAHRATPSFTANAAGEYRCPREDCEAVERSLAAIRSHYRAHASVLCDVCGKRVLKHNIRSHKARHTVTDSALPEVGGGGGERSKLGCTHCGGIYSDVRALRIHLRVKHGEGDLEFKCDLCSACFVRRTAFVAHVERCRVKDSVKTRRCVKKPVDPNSEYSKFKVPVDPDKPFKCPEPDCNYEDARFLKRHYLDKHVTKVCPLCNKTLTYNHYDRHVKTMHTKKFEFKCPEPGCREEFYNRRLLECHREEAHVRELKYTCHHCARMFFSQYRLSTHVTRAHNSPRHFPCHHDGCGKVYTDGSSLKKHLRRYHPAQVEASPF